jgi:hypothetical protein
MREIILSPNAASLSQSMRDIGYSLETAIADLIDNSISAGAKTVRVCFDGFETPHPCLAIIDDGSGMSEPEALEAMRPGSRDPRLKRDADDLGRFGLGLKTASFSQCRSLTVVSRKDNSTFAACWDLDLISHRNEWVAQVLSADEIQALPLVDQMSELGTCVIWQKMDRLLESQQYISSRNDMYTRLEQVEQHLALIYHRYLSGEYRKRKITILVNGHSVEPFDPFCTSHKATQMLPEEIVRIEGEEIRIQPFILPHHSKLPKADYDYYRRRSDFFSNQGAYIYRNGRLMSWGDWFRLVPKTEATKLARVRIDFSNALDEHWTIDIKKSRAHPPPQVREKMRQIIDRVTEQSRRVHTGRGDRLFTQQQPVWDRHMDRAGVRYTINRDHPLLNALKENTQPELWIVLSNILDVIENSIPIEAIYADYSSRPQAFEEKPDVSEEYLLNVLTAFSSLFRTKGILDRKRMAAALLPVQPFSQNRELTQKLIEEML